MEKRETSIPGVWELLPPVFRDSRGAFFETFHCQKFDALGIHVPFVQDNHSISGYGTVRGLHYQLRHPQAKLCRVVEGSALDVALDIRWGSPTFGKWTSVLLVADKHNQIFIPAGFAHGFVALSDKVQFLYKCSDFYDPSDDYGILWNDPDLAIPWNVDSPQISAKDARFSKLSDVSHNLLPVYTA